MQVGYLPPIYDGGELLVDGAYSDNLPAGPMRLLMGSDAYIIGVDVEVPDNPYQGPELPDAVSGWLVIWRRLLHAIGLFPAPPLQSDLISILKYMPHTNNVQASRAFLDICLRPPVNDYGLLEYKRAEEIVSRAEAYALNQLQAFALNAVKGNSRALL